MDSQTYQSDEIDISKRILSNKIRRILIDFETLRSDEISKLINHLNQIAGIHEVLGEELTPTGTTEISLVE